PTAIQSRAIPVILQGNDLIGAAQSGSGKTGAYVLPILARLLDSPARLRAIVLTPTRELAQYVETRARDYARFTGVRIGVVFTGAPLATHEKMLRDEPVDVLVATPGRLLELHGRGVLNFEDVEVLVLEEADRMVALGLAFDLRRLLKLLPETRQTLMFTMSMPPELNRLAKEALVEPVRVDLAPVAKSGTGISQAIYPVPRDLKSDLLAELLSRHEVRNTLIFARARAGAERYTRQMAKRGYTVCTLDDHPSQNAREQLVDDLKRGKVQILVSSDAAARSLDLTGIAHVINADVPQSPEDYVHRLGRVGAPDAIGDVFTLMSPEEQKNVAAIERLVGRAIPRVLLPDFDYNMHPSEFHMAVSYGDEPPLTRRVPGGLQLAAAKIASVPKSNASRSATMTKSAPAAKNGVPGKAVHTARPAPALKPVPAQASQDKKVVAVRPAKPAAKKPKAVRPARQTPGKQIARSAKSPDRKR
ncbi:MAG: DEAD/DEAH box helicase, partial [Candidatus Eisenbacteria bacterium]